MYDGEGRSLTGHVAHIILILNSWPRLQGRFHISSEAHLAWGLAYVAIELLVPRIIESWVVVYNCRLLDNCLSCLCSSKTVYLPIDNYTVCRPQSERSIWFVCLNLIVCNRICLLGFPTFQLQVITYYVSAYESR